MKFFLDDNEVFKLKVVKDNSDGTNKFKVAVQSDNPCINACNFKSMEDIVNSGLLECDDAGFLTTYVAEEILSDYDHVRFVKNNKDFRIELMEQNKIQPTYACNSLKEFKQDFLYKEIMSKNDAKIEKQKFAEKYLNK